MHAVSSSVAEEESSREPYSAVKTVDNSCQFQSELELPSMTTGSGVPASTMDEFSHYEESSGAFGACEGNNNGQDHDEDDNYSSKSSSIWELMMTIYIPLVALWMRRSVFGITVLVRTVILGHLLRLVFGSFSEWMHDKMGPSSSWIHHAFWQPMGPHTKPDPKAWPPPALTALALCTVFTLVVHPDGFTWIMMGKVKNAILSTLQSLSECWQLLITDYGVLPSIIASITLAALMFLMFTMLRSIIPRRTRRASPAPDKKKKKRKGHARHRGGTGKAKSAPSTPSRAAGAAATDDAYAPAHSRDATSPTRSLEDSAPDLTPLTPSSSVRNTKSHHGSTIKVEGDSIRELDDLPETSVCPTPILPIAAATKTTFEKDIRGRTRVPSVSTLDTTAMSDDLSCGSTSIRSLPSVGMSMSLPAATTLSSPQSSEQKLSIFSAPSPTTNNSGDLKPKAATSNPRRNKRLGNANPKTKMNPPKGTEGPSRWDALKPAATAVKHVHPADRQNSNGKPVENLNRQQLQGQTSSSHRPSNRRAGRGAGAGATWKGRSTNIQDASTQSNIPGSPIRGNRVATLSPVSPPHFEHHDISRFSLPTPDSLMPPPPPGLGPTSVASHERFNDDSRLFPLIQQKSCSDDVPFLVPIVQGNASPARSWDHANNAQAFALPSILTEESDDKHHHQHQEWNHPARFGSSPARVGTSSCFHGSPAGSLGYGGVKENPFAPDTVSEATATRGSDEQIEADLQELGGQMVGSILDF